MQIGIFLAAKLSDYLFILSLLSVIYFSIYNREKYFSIIFRTIDIPSIDRHSIISRGMIIISIRLVQKIASVSRPY